MTGDSKRRRSSQKQSAKTGTRTTSSSARWLGSPISTTRGHLGAQRRERRQQRRVRAVTGEVLARGHLEHAERADDRADGQRRPPWFSTPTTSPMPPTRIANSETGKPPKSPRGRSPTVAPKNPGRSRGPAGGASDNLPLSDGDGTVRPRLRERLRRELLAAIARAA